jgi:polysaccharide deacetylase family protein (PEP-CTERM system associated)
MTSIVNMLTVDVEDYFHVSAFASSVSRDDWDHFESRVERNTDKLLGIFAEAGIHATFFVLGWVAERHPELLKRIVAGGHEVASHSHSHRLVYEMTPDEFRFDLRRAKGVIEAVTAVPVRGFRAPSFSITERSTWALDVLRQEGYQYDASIFPIHHDRYGIPNASRYPHMIRGGATVAVAEKRLLEVPASTIRFGGMNFPIGGGGYFRILPYAWTAFGIRRLNEREGMPAMVYLHPWEIDPDQPRLKASRLSRFRHYRHLAKTEPRLRRLLAEFRFAPIRDVIS